MRVIDVMPYVKVYPRLVPGVVSPDPEVVLQRKVLGYRRVEGGYHDLASGHGLQGLHAEALVIGKVKPEAVAVVVLVKPIVGNEVLKLNVRYEALKVNVVARDAGDNDVYRVVGVPLHELNERLNTVARVLTLHVVRPVVHASLLVLRGPGRRHNYAVRYDVHILNAPPGQGVLNKAGRELRWRHDSPEVLEDGIEDVVKPYDGRALGDGVKDDVTRIKVGDSRPDALVKVIKVYDPPTAATAEDVRTPPCVKGVGDHVANYGVRPRKAGKNADVRVRVGPERRKRLGPRGKSQAQSPRKKKRFGY